MVLAQVLEFSCKSAARNACFLHIFVASNVVHSKQCAAPTGQWLSRETELESLLVQLYTVIKTNGSLESKYK